MKWAFIPNGWLQHLTLMSLAVFVIAPCAVHAGNTIGVLPVESTKYPSYAEQLTKELRSAVLDHPSYQDKGSVEFSLSEVRMSFSCFDEGLACMSTVGKTLKVDVLIWGKLTQTATAIRAQLTGLNVKDGSTFHTATYYFPDKTSFKDNLLGATKAFIERRPFKVKQMYSFRIETIPPGGLVAIDGVEKGVAPQTIRLPDGRYRLSVRMNGYSTERTILAPSKPMERVVVRLKEAAVEALTQPMPRELAETDRSAPKASRWPLWTGLGLAAAATGLGIVSSYYWYDNYRLADQGKTEMDEAQRSKLESSHNSAVKMMFGTGISSAVLGLGAVYFLFLHQTEDTPQVSVGPGQLLFHTRF